MTSVELDWATAQIEAADSTEATKDDDQDGGTEATQDDDQDATEATQDDELRMGADDTELTKDADDTDMTVDKFGGIGRAASPKIPASQIIARDIAIEPTAPLASLPADTDAAFGQWLAGSGLPSLN